LPATIFNSWVNILLIAALIGPALSYVGVVEKAAFIVNFITIIPLTGILGFTAEEISLHVEESLRHLLSTLFRYAAPLSPRRPTNMTK
jgi:Ca2+:H+ antiporter